MCGTNDDSAMSYISDARNEKPNRNVRIFDNTLRDGAQTPGVNFTLEEKVEIAARLRAYGVTTIEAGFPASSPES